MYQLDSAYAQDIASLQYSSQLCAQGRRVLGCCGDMALPWEGAEHHGATCSLSPGGIVERTGKVEVQELTNLTTGLRGNGLST